MARSRRDGNHWLTETGQFRRGHADRVRVIAQLTILAIAPRPDHAIGLERQVMIMTARNGHDRVQTADLNPRGRAPRVKVAIAQLALIAEAPGPYCAVGLERQVMIITARNRRDSSQTAHLNRRGHDVKVAIAQLAIVAT